MAQASIQYREPLQDDERAFLQRRIQQDSALFLKVLKIVMVFCFLLPFAMAWGTAIQGKPNPFSFERYFIGVGVLLCITAIAAAAAYRSNLYLLRRDVKENVKTIEPCIIIRKYAMNATGKYFFYLATRTRLSIEVSAADFENFDLGDEINIEYASYSKSYFGYFWQGQMRKKIATANSAK